MTDSGLILGIDGGQTSTKALLATAAGKALATGTGGPSDHFQSQAAVRKNRVAIHGAIEHTLSQLGRSPSDVIAVGVGSTGAPPEGRQNPIVEEIVLEVLPHLSPDRVAVLADYKTNLLGATGGKPGIVLIAGGGCVAYGITVDDREGIAGGYGYLIGDQGSAFDIGLRAIDATIKADDLRGPNTALEAMVCEHFGIGKIREIKRVVYADGFSREQISLLTPNVVAVAEQGDVVARAILEGAAADAAETVLGVIRQLAEPGEQVRVHLTGGVFNAGPLVRAPFDAALLRAWPETEIAEPRFSPVVGTLIAGAQIAGIDVNERWLSSIERSMSRFAAGP